jgi:hypothetical protein
MPTPNANLLDAFTPCLHCKRDMPLGETACPHCGQSAPEPTGFTRYATPGGEKGIADASTVLWLRAHAQPAPSTAEVAKLFVRVTHATIRLSTVAGSEVSPQFTNPADLARLQAALAVGAPRGHVMCPPEYMIDLYRDGALIAYLELVGYAILRADRWKCDAEISDPAALVALLARHNFPEPAEAFERDTAQREQDAAIDRLWQSATPKSLRNLMVQSRATGDDYPKDLTPYRTALASANPVPADQVATLLDWLGTGIDFWDAHHMEEILAYRLLALVPVEAFAAALADPSPARAAGVTRFLHFASQYDLPLPALAPATRARLLTLMQSHLNTAAREIAASVLR